MGKIVVKEIDECYDCPFMTISLDGVEDWECYKTGKGLSDDILNIQRIIPDFCPLPEVE